MAKLMDAMIELRNAPKICGAMNAKTSAKKYDHLACQIVRTNVAIKSMIINHCGFSRILQNRIGVSSSNQPHHSNQASLAHGT